VLTVKSANVAIEPGKSGSFDNGLKQLAQNVIASSDLARDFDRRLSKSGGESVAAVDT